MQGFDKKFKDFPDYILGITNEIWEQRGIETLNHYYSDDIIVRSPECIVIGNKKVINATKNTLKEFPDRDISKIPHPFISESINLFSKLSKIDKQKIHFIHFNHTNPVLSKNYYNDLISDFNLSKQGSTFSL